MLRELKIEDDTPLTIQSVDGTLVNSTQIRMKLEITKGEKL